MNSTQTIKKEDFNFFSPTGKWLFQKIKLPLLTLFLLTFFKCYFSALIRFNVRTNFNKNNPGHGEVNWFLGKQKFNPPDNPQWYFQLLIILLVSFLLGVLVLDMAGRFLQDYCENLSKNWLRKLIIYYCLYASPEVLKKHQVKINNVIFYNVPRLAFYFINIPLKFWENLVKIGFEFYFFYFFLSSKIEARLKSLTLGFNLIVILVFLSYIWLTTEWQKQKKWEKMQRSQTERQQTQLILHSLTGDLEKNKKKKQAQVAKIFQLFDRNLKKNKPYFLQKIIFDLPTLIIPGLNVIFYNNLIFFIFLDNKLTPKKVFIPSHTSYKKPILLYKLNTLYKILSLSLSLSRTHHNNHSHFP